MITDVAKHNFLRTKILSVTWRTYTFASQLVRGDCFTIRDFD